MGWTSEAREILGRLQEAAAKRYVSPYQIALIYVNLGETEEAFAQLKKALALRDGWLIWLNVEPQFDLLRSDPRFAELVCRILPAKCDNASGGLAEAAPQTLELEAPPPTNGDTDTDRQKVNRRQRLPSRIVAGALSVALAGGAVAAFLYSRTLINPHALAANPVRLTNNLVVDSQPDLSPDNMQIIFTSNRDDNSEIYVKPSDSTNRLPKPTPRSPLSNSTGTRIWRGRKRNSAAPSS